jgi:hypothetical protein
MPGETALGAAVRLTIAMEAAAALAAHIRVETEGLDVDPQVRTLLGDIAAEVADDAGNIGPSGQSIVGMVRAFMRQSAELAENPGRVGDWDHVDEVILQGVGRLSMAIVDAFMAATASVNECRSQVPRFSMSAPARPGWQLRRLGHFRPCA